MKTVSEKLGNHQAQQYKHNGNSRRGVRERARKIFEEITAENLQI